MDTIKHAGNMPQDLAFDGRSDYDSVTRAGIPSGNFDTGADDTKTPEQVQLWGRIVDQPCDPNYRAADDTIANVNHDALALSGGVIAYVVGMYAQDESGRNGVPVRDARHPLPAK